MDPSVAYKHLESGYGILMEAIATRQLPNDIPSDVLQTCAWSSILGFLILICLVPRIRRFIFQSVESVIAILLLLALVLILVGMPIGG